MVHATPSRLGAGVLILGVLLVLAAGCQTDELVGDRGGQQPAGPTTSLENPAGVDLAPIQIAGRSEVDLVEEMILHRAMYARFLRALVTFYSENGYEDKANWARAELRDLQKVKPYRYILDAEVPRADLKPATSIPEADRLYDEGLALMKKAGHGVIIWYNDATMKRALGKLMELIDKYPNSDKVDDAAYYIGEIHKEYGEERDNLIAIEWYKRAIQYNPNLDYPAWSRIAHVYDHRLHEREKALEWYQKVIQFEDGKTGPLFANNVHYANQRITQLTREETRYAAGEDIPGERPEPSNSAAPGSANEAPSEPAPVK